MEKEILTIGQKAVVDGFLANFDPSDSYDSDTCWLVDSASIINDLSDMCDIDSNSLADYLASLGYRFFINIETNISGWIFLVKNQKS